MSHHGRDEMGGERASERIDWDMSVSQSTIEEEEDFQKEEEKKANRVETEKEIFIEERRKNNSKLRRLMDVIFQL